MRNVSMVLWFLMAALFLTAGTQAAVTTLIDDGFVDGGRTNGADALDTDWWQLYPYTLGIDATGLGSGNAISIDGDGTSVVLANFTSQTLDSVQESISLSFDIKLKAVGGETRFGLLNSNGTLQQVDLPLATLSDDTLTDNDPGYYISLYTSGANNLRIYEEDGNNNSIMAGTDITNRASGNGIGITDTNVHSAKLTFTYISGSVQVDFVLDEGMAGQLTATYTDSTPKLTFNEVAFGLRSGQDAFIDNIVVKHTLPDNLEPVVNAGADAVVLKSEVLVLNATATDSDGPSPLTYAWTAAGPGTATFTPSAAVEDPNVTFNAGGIYTLTLEVSDGVNIVTDSLQVGVHDAADDALLALWNFETATPADPNVFDAVGDNDGVWTLTDPNSEPNYVDGWITGTSPNLAAKFYAGEYIEIQPADSNELNLGLRYGLTVACWVRVDNAAAFEAFDRIIEKGVWGLTASSNTETVKFTLTGQNSNGVTAVTPVIDGYWHHVAGVYDGKSMSIYVDGIMETTHSTNGLLPVTTSNVTIGANNAFGQQFDGVAVDDVRVYNYGLNAAAVAALAAMGDNLVPHVTVTPSATSIQLPANTISLNATALEPDGESLTYAWSLVGGPAAVTFTAPAALTTNAVFTAGGRYTLRLSVDDGTAVISADVTVTVFPEGYNGELAHMPYDNQDANDVSFWGYKATVYGSPTYTTSSQTGSGAIKLNGTSDYLEYDPAMASVDGGDLTFCAWVRPDDVGDADMAIAGNFWNGNTTEPGWMLWFEGDSTKTFKLWIGEYWSSGATYDSFITPNLSYTPGQWVHVTMTFKYNSGTGNEVKIYADAEEILSATTNYEIGPSSVPFTVGRRPNDDSRYLNGAVDELYLFGRVLPQEEIAELAGLNTPPIVDAGKLKKIVLPTNSVFLNGSAQDTDPITVQWSVVDGPAAATFNPVNDPNTTATFTAVGDYLLRLTATDSFNQTASDDILVKVRPVGFDGLEAYITFENADPNLAVDSAVGIGYKGTPYGDPNAGFEASDAKVGAGALELNGLNQYIDYGRYLGAENQITVMFWAKPKVLTDQHPMQKWASDTTNVGWHTRIRATGQNFAPLVGSGFAPNGFWVGSPLALSVDTWVHLAFTFDGSVLNVFQDGALVARAEADDENISPADIVTPMVIGYRTNNGTRYYNGLIDEVRIYDYALSVEAIKAKYASDGGLPWNTCLAPALAGDLSQDCRVDMLDMAALGAGWQNPYTITTLMSVAQTWLDCDDLDLSKCL